MTSLDSVASFLPQTDLPGITHGFALDLKGMLGQRKSPHLLRQTVGIASQRGVKIADLMSQVGEERIKLEEILDKEPGYWVASASVRGAQHERESKLNADAVRVQEIITPTGNLAIIAAVADDGHGGAKYVRSPRGAQVAVDVAVSQFTALANYFPDLRKGITDLFEVELCKYLARGWRDAVEVDIAHNPITESEIEYLPIKDQKELRDNPYLAYGSTLLAHLRNTTYDAYPKLGNGEIQDLSLDGIVTNIFPDKDERLMANETTSLVSANPQNEMRVIVIRRTDEDRKQFTLTILSTDGLSNSFKDDDGIQKFNRDVADNARKDGLASIGSELPNWLQATSQKGSDDITAAIIFEKANFKV